MSLPETCPFCGAAVSVDDDGKKRVAHLVVIFACGTGFHELIDSRKTQSRECKEREMQARLAALEAENKALRDRVEELDTERQGAQIAIRRAYDAASRAVEMRAAGNALARHVAEDTRGRTARQLVEAWEEASR